MEYLSNCCGAEILMADRNGHGKCSDCLENCCPEEPEEMPIFEGTRVKLNNLTIIK